MVAEEEKKNRILKESIRIGQTPPFFSPEDRESPISDDVTKKPITIAIVYPTHFNKNLSGMHAHID